MLYVEGKNSSCRFIIQVVCTLKNILTNNKQSHGWSSNEISWWELIRLIRNPLIFHKLELTKFTQIYTNLLYHKIHMLMVVAWAAVQGPPYLWMGEGKFHEEKSRRALFPAKLCFSIMVASQIQTIKIKKARWRQTFPWREV